MRDSRHWGDFPAVFRREHAASERLNIVLIDLPGNGSLNRMQSPSDVHSMVEHCRRELAARHIQPPYTLLAMSLGAMATVAWAERYPQELAACVLINTSLRPFSPFHQRLRPENYPSILKLALLGGSDAAWESHILHMTSNLASERERLVARWSEWRRQFPVARANALRQLWAASRYRAPLQKPPPPMLILAAAADRLVSPDCSRRLAAHWRTDFAEHPTAGHDLPLDDGPWVAQHVRRWLQRSCNNRPR